MEGVREVALSELRVDGVQTRAEIRPEAVADYAEALREGAEFPPGIAYDDGAALWLAAGHHRRRAYELAGKDVMPVEIRQGSKLDALLAGAKDNLDHRAERASLSDKQYAVETILKEGPGLSNRQIAEACGVAHKTVARRRKALELTGDMSPVDFRVGSDGRATNTANIGRHRASAESIEAGGPSAELDFEHHSCGGQWGSDGEGGRYCERCLASHPENAQPYPDAIPPTEPTSPVEKSQSAELRSSLSKRTSANTPEDRFRKLLVEIMGDAHREMDVLAKMAPGPEYTVCAARLNAFSDSVSQWREQWREDVSSVGVDALAQATPAAGCKHPAVLEAEQVPGIVTRRCRDCGAKLPGPDEAPF